MEQVDFSAPFPGLSFFLCPHSHLQLTEFKSLGAASGGSIFTETPLVTFPIVKNSTCPWGKQESWTQLIFLEFWILRRHFISHTSFNPHANPAPFTDQGALSRSHNQ